MRAIFFSDIHLHIWGKFNENNRRTKSQFKIIENLFALAHRYKAPIIFTGDLFHDPESLSNELYSMFQPWFNGLFRLYPGVTFYGLSGNHDMRNANTLRLRSPSYIHTLSNSINRFRCIDFDSVELDDKTMIHGVPYLTHNEGIMEAINKCNTSTPHTHILLLHTDFKGQKDTNGIEVGRGEGIDEEVFTRFKHVISGHIHKPGKVRKNIISVGSPCQMRSSDMGGDFGYWVLEDNFKMVFKPITYTPEFKYYDKESETDNFHFWLKRPVDGVTIEKESRSFNLTSKADIVDAYMQYEGIQSKSKSRYLKNLLSKVEAMYEENNI